MTEPTRWSRPDSEVDPVLRATLRYARDLAPSNVEMQALLRRVGAHEVPRRLDDAQGLGARRLRPLPSSSRGKLRKLLLAAVVTFGCGGMAWAAYVTVRARTDARQVTVEPNSTKPRSLVAQGGEAFMVDALPLASSPVQQRPPVSPNSNVASADPKTTASKTTTTEAASTEPSSRRNVRAASKDVETSPQDEANLLRQARAAMVGTPERALALLQTHARSFPRSELVEERAELQVEALHRLGRTDEAKRARTAFELRFPNSPYRRRLRALMVDPNAASAP